MARFSETHKDVLSHFGISYHILINNILTHELKFNIILKWSNMKQDIIGERKMLVNMYQSMNNVLLES